MQLDRTASHNGTRSWDTYTTQEDDVYPGWDGFGRVNRQLWVDGDFDENTATLPNKPPLFEEEYKYDRVSNRTHRLDVRPGAHLGNRDSRFDYDPLDRLTKSQRGEWDGSDVGGTDVARTQQWQLDLLGNWDLAETDLDGNGDFTGPFESDDRDHESLNNELTTRSILGYSSSLTILHDDNGNLTQADLPTGQVQRRVYVYDAWNRLVRIDLEIDLFGAGTYTTTRPLAEFEYNGLNWLVVQRTNPVPVGPTLDHQRFLYYSADWQLLEEHIDPDNDGMDSDDPVAQQFWGIRRIDDAAYRRIDRDGDGDFDGANDIARFYVTDVQGNVVALIESDAGSSVAIVRDRVTYDAYGVALHRWGGDVDGNGYIEADPSSGDIGEIFSRLFAQIGDANYIADADINRDGVINTNDSAVLFTTWLMTGDVPPLPSGFISDPDEIDNRIGYAGYVLQADLALYVVRNRWYEPEYGRFLTRDPAGYVDGMSLYLYAMASPWSALDPFGLFAEPPNEQVARAQYAFPFLGFRGSESKFQTQYSRSGARDDHDSRQITPNARAALEAMERVEYYGNVAAERAQISGYIPFAEASVSFVPGIGEAMDLVVVCDPTQPLWVRGLALASLGLSGVTLGFAPNFGAALRARRADGIADSGTTFASHGADIPDELRYVNRREIDDDMGQTDAFGRIRIADDLTGSRLVETVRHELVHRFFSPGNANLIQRARSLAGEDAYVRFQLVKYVEEAVAEAFATRSISQGLAFPIKEGYVSGRVVATQGGALLSGYGLSYLAGNRIGHSIGAMIDDQQEP